MKAENIPLSDCSQLVRVEEEVEGLLCTAHFFCEETKIPGVGSQDSFGSAQVLAGESKMLMSENHRLSS